MPLHRLTDVSYNGGSLPVTHDKINTPADNGDPGLPALADSGKLTVAGHPNEGTYYIGFGEDGLSENGNRAHNALAQNTDFLDDICSGDVPVPAELEATASAPISTLVITGEVFMGMSGIYTDTQPFRDRLVKVLDSSTGNDLVDASGVKIEVTLIRDNLNLANRVGVPSSGFETNPTITFSPPIPNGATYRIVYGKRSTLEAGIRSKTDLDLLVRLAIRASQQASAETIRFITQSARRTGGNVTALAATIVETPLNSVAPGGSILPKANAMWMDVDPDDSQGTGGTWGVRFDRDVGAQIQFQVNENTVGNATWENVKDRIAFKDLNTTGAGFAEDHMPLTSGVGTNGDGMLRVLDNDPGVSFSITKRLNSAWAVTVGNGSTTYGDFNGTAAIADAVAFAIANSVTDLRIVVKKGTYDVSNLSIGAGSINSIKIEGVSENGCVIHNTAGVSGAGLILAQNLVVHLQYLQFTSDAAGTVEVRSNDAILRVEDCTFSRSLEYSTQSGVVLNRGQTLYVARTDFYSSIVGVPAVLFTCNDIPNFRNHGFVFEDCLFDCSAIDTPAVQLFNSVQAGSPSLSGVLFDRCRFSLAGATVSAGDMVGNSGVFEVVHDTTLGPYTGLTVKDLTWKDCLVEATSVGDTPVLLVLVTGNGTDDVDFRKVAIDGGRWTFDVDCALAPFYIGGGADTYGGGASPPGEVVIKDVDWGDSSGSNEYGAAHSFYNSIGVGESGGFVVIADVVRMHRVTWLNTSTLSTLGDLLVDAQQIDIDSLSFPNSITAGALGTTPVHRIRIRDAGGYNSRIANVKVRANVAAAATTSAWNILSGGQLTLYKCTAEDFIGGAINGFFIPSGTEANGKVKDISFVECVGNGNSNDGFLYSHDGVQTDNFERLVFDRCTFSGNSGRGLAIVGTTGDPTPDGVRIVNSTFQSNTAHGIRFSPGTSSSKSGTVICHNFLYFNSGGSASDQIQIGDSVNLSGNNIIGTIIGNDLRGGGIHFDGAVANAVMVGAETGYTVTIPASPHGAGALGSFDAGDRVYTNGVPTIHNNGYYSE